MGVSCSPISLLLFDWNSILLRSKLELNRITFTGATKPDVRKQYVPRVRNERWRGDPRAHALTLTYSQPAAIPRAS